MNKKEHEAGSLSVKSNSGQQFRCNRITSKLLMIACLSMAVLLCAMEINSESLRSAETNERRSRMFLTKSNIAINNSDLPVEAAVTTNLETATFALG
ncbi:MAG: hypothetical protein HY912_14895 [Desulfomonile tiedjei]|uniref:Uncharacterized protein n=1 Tax=Desulfomonile tiedjei TaxID=2358 RepID=A0A9D6V2A9_9BACT|nr:hypothetical protein [Desulfomonile tiedjei]